MTNTPSKGQSGYPKLDPERLGKFMSDKEDITVVRKKDQPKPDDKKDKK